MEAGNGHVDFNLQSFLSEMRAEMRDGFSDLTSQANQITMNLNSHEKVDIAALAAVNQKLSAVESFNSAVVKVLWTLCGGVVLGVVGVVFDFVKNHIR